VVFSTAACGLSSIHRFQFRNPFHLKPSEEIAMSKQADADLILKLYDLRREATMREARNWFFTFNPTTVNEYMETMFGEHSGHLRMVVSYWEMAASLVNNGAIDEQMFNDANGEHLFVFAKIEPILEDLRKLLNAPEAFGHFEKLVRNIPDNEKKLAAIRERIKMIQATMAERMGKAQSA
jgi:hypothetical protein